MRAQLKSQAQPLGEELLQEGWCFGVRDLCGMRPRAFGFWLLVAALLLTARTCAASDAGITDEDDPGECAPGCLTAFVGDLHCDRECFVAECEWDAGDCERDCELVGRGCDTCAACAH